MLLGRRVRSLRSALLLGESSAAGNLVMVVAVSYCGDSPSDVCMALEFCAVC